MTLPSDSTTEQGRPSLTGEPITFSRGLLGFEDFRRFTLQRDFHFKPGQYATLWLTHKGKTVPRPYSIASSPAEFRTLEFYINLVREGRLTHSLWDPEVLKGLQTGDSETSAAITGPKGKFVLDPEDKLGPAAPRHLLRGGVHVGDLPCSVDGDKGVDARLDEAAVVGACRPERLFGPGARLDLPGEHRGAPGHRLFEKFPLLRELRLLKIQAAVRLFQFLGALGQLTGKNMGEAARLWIFLIPFVIWIAAPLFDPPVLPSSASPQGAGNRTDGRAGWNLLAGYGGMVSIGQQAFAGSGKIAPSFDPREDCS